MCNSIELLSYSNINRIILLLYIRLAMKYGFLDRKSNTFFIELNNIILNWFIHFNYWFLLLKQHLFPTFTKKISFLLTENWIWYNWTPSLLIFFNSRCLVSIESLSTEMPGLYVGCDKTSHPALIIITEVPKISNVNKG